MYITKQNDTFDLIAYKVYGDSKYMGYLLQNNMPLIDVFLFDSGVEINIPELAKDINENLPDWRK